VAKRRIRRSAVVAGVGYDARAGFNAARQLLAERPDITGIFAANVMIAIGVLRAAGECARRVPDDLSVIALHDFPLAEFLQPPLSTVSMPLAELGAAAVDLLLERLDGGLGARRTLLTPPTLIVRSSTGPPR
jgi:DNA-binding LacI/PurR family transcriptional regulator